MQQHQLIGPNPHSLMAIAVTDRLKNKNTLNLCQISYKCLVYLDCNYKYCKLRNNRNSYCGFGM